MRVLTIPTKLLSPYSTLPTKQTKGSAGFDLTASSVESSPSLITVGSGIALALPEHVYALLLPRSSIYKKNLVLANSIGLIDSDYRGEIKGIFYPMDKQHNDFLPGERWGQLLIQCTAFSWDEIVFAAVDELPSTDRGTNGFGSTGNF